MTGYYFSVQKQDRVWGSNHRNFFPRSLSQDLKAQASTNCGKIAKNDRKNRFET